MPTRHEGMRDEKATDIRRVLHVLGFLLGPGLSMEFHGDEV